MLQSKPAPPPPALLSEASFWRKAYVFMPVVYAADAAAAATRPADAARPPAKPFAADFDNPPPAGWTGADFDDSAWLLRRGREFVCGDGRAMEYLAPSDTNAYLRGTDPFLPGVGLVCQRGTFLVRERAAVKKLTLNLTYRGGFVAYLNGKECARANLPAPSTSLGQAGKLAPDAPSEVYPLDAFFVFLERGSAKPEGLHWYTHSKSDQWPLRERSFGPVDLPTGQLRDGRNVLAIEFHRSVYPDECKKGGLQFATLGLSLLELKAEPSSTAAAAGVRLQASGTANGVSAVPEVRSLKSDAASVRDGLQVWPADITKGISDRACPGQDEKLGPVRIAACANGVFAGQVMVASDKALEGLSAGVSALAGPSGKTISGNAVKVRYAAPNPLWGRGGLGYLDTVLPGDAVIDRNVFMGRRLDLLLETPPARPERVEGPDASAVGVWVSVKVPKDAAPGLYKGELTIAVKGAEPVKAPLEMNVSGWSLPEVKDYVGLLNIYQSPDTLAEYYKVKRWSDEHWKLIDKSMQLMGGIGNIGLFIPLLAQSQMGNPESMVVWLKQPDGSYKYDFSVFDRYLDTALRYHDRLFFVALNVWGYETRRDGAQVTVMDSTATQPGSTGLKPVPLMTLPPYGTPECEALWRPLLLAVRDRLKARGLDGKILLGLPSDGGPPPPHAGMFRNILPEAGWITESHMRIGSYVCDASDKAKTVPVRYNSIVWGGSIPDPASKRLYGWQHPKDVLVMNFNRAGTECLVLNGYPGPWSFHMWMESTLACGRNGNGRCGADYWRIGTQLVGGRGSSEAVGGSGGTLFGVYLYSATGQTGLGNSVTDLLAPAPDGPATTVRFENVREGNQEAEARVFLEKALLDKAKPLPAALATKCQRLLDERSNVLRMWSMGASALAPYRWQERARALFDAAGEVRKASASAEAATDAPPRRIAN